MTENLTVGERVAWYRRRRGMSQEVLAGLVGRTADWLQRAENNRIQLDRLSVIRDLAQVLDISIGDLIGEPTLLDWTADSRTQTVPALRAVLMDYSQLSPLLTSPDEQRNPLPLGQLGQQVDDIFDAYQHSRFGYVTAHAPRLLQDAVAAARAADGDAAIRAHELLALSYQAAASVLTNSARPTWLGSRPSAGLPPLSAAAAGWCWVRCFVRSPTPCWPQAGSSQLCSWSTGPRGCSAPIWARRTGRCYRCMARCS
jgi:transcriptional regulator with XRE-family HTH domain